MPKYFTSLSYLCVALLIGGCVSSKRPEVVFNHPTHGQVKFDHPAFIADKGMCAEASYNQGVRIKDQVVYTRSNANKLWSDEAFKLARASMNAGYHGAMAGAAVSSGNPKLLSSSSTSSTALEYKLNNISPEYQAAEEKFEACLVKSGWQRTTLKN